MRVNANPTFTSPAQLTVVGSDDLATIDITWRHKRRDDLKEWAARPLRVTERGIVPLEVEAEYLAEVIAGWKGPVNDNGDPVPFSQAALANVLQNYAMAGQELYNQYLRAMTESRLKN